MGVGFVVGDVAREVGSPDFLEGFFSTISYYLEPGGWGTKYPELMLKLYQGQLNAGDASKALNDLQEIRLRLKDINPPRIIWDIDDPNIGAPWGGHSTPEGRDLSNSFVTSNGEDVFDVLTECLEHLAERGGQLTIEPY
jgi:2,3-bisphosphoglycerate-dependent phosphoglycerate mutase